MKLVMKIALGVILAVVLLIAGCTAVIAVGANEASKEVNKKHAWVVEISAPDEGCWSGSIGQVTEEGCGDKTLRFEDMAISGAVVQKQTDGKWTLGVALKADGEAVDAKQSSAAYGVVTVSGSDF